MTTKKAPIWLRSPIVAFLAIGVALFALQAVVSGSDPDATRREISVGEPEIRFLNERWTRQWNRPPTERELRALVDDYVRQEVMYREAVGLGLGRDDEVIKRRLVQKLELLTEDLAAQVEPTDAELQAYLDRNRDRYMVPERRTFQQVYVDASRRGEAAREEAERILTRLRSAPGDARASELGDGFLLEYEHPLQAARDVARLFGSAFSESLFELDVGEWQGPVVSGYGLHLVRVSDVEEERMPELDDVLGYVLSDYQREIREEAQDRLLAGILERYAIEIDEEAISMLSLEAPAESGAP